MSANGMDRLLPPRDRHGQTVLTKLAVTDPGKLATIAYDLLPRDIFLSVETKAPGKLDPEDCLAASKLFWKTPRIH